MPKPTRVFFVSVAVLYALVLGCLVFETARIAAAVPPSPAALRVLHPVPSG